MLRSVRTTGAEVVQLQLAIQRQPQLVFHPGQRRQRRHSGQDDLHTTTQLPWEANEHMTKRV